MQRRDVRGVMARISGLGFCWLCVSVLLPACAPNRPVYIPPEYREPVPPGYSVPRTQPPPAVEAPQQQGPIIEKTPEFRKQDIPATPSPQAQPHDQQPQQPPARKQEAQSPQLIASMQLVSEARRPLDRGKPDLAIPVLERAIQADVQNAEAYMLLARAWRQKGEKRKALEFARKAEILYQDEPARLKEVLLLEADLYKEMGDNSKSGQYRKRAESIR